MVGGLINIVSYGFNDLYLTASPEITFFIAAYRRHTNFSKESIEIPIGQMDFDEKVTINIPKLADLFTEAFLQFEIPEIWLKKYDTADGLTQDEFNFLMSPQNIPMSQNEIDIVNSYQTILDFIQINSSGYRTAISSQYVKNQSPIDYIDSIIDSMNYSNQEDDNYKNALDAAKTFEETQGMKDLFIFDYTMSDINYILRKLKDKLLDDILNNIENNYTISLILKIVINAMNTSALVKKYFFEKLQKKHKLELDANSNYAKFAWVANLGYSMIDYVDINIGGERIDRHYGDWMNIWYELTSIPERDKMHNEMIGNVKILTTFDRNAKPKYTIHVPLNFWFCKKAGLAFPLIALQYSPVSITLKLKSINECAYLEQLPIVDNDGDELNLTQFTLADIWDNMGFKINASLLVEFIYLGDLERKRFAQTAHEYLIETVDQMTIENITDKNINANLEFFGPSKEIIWHIKKNELNSNNYNYKKYPNVYSMDIKKNIITDNVSFSQRKHINPFTDAHLLLNGRERFFNQKFFDKAYYSIIQPMNHHKRIPSEGINLYSFALHPEEHQPSSACNFSLISKSTLNLSVEENMFKYLLSDVNPNILPGSDHDEVLDTKLTLTIYSVRYNVIRFIGGMGAFAYSYNVSN